MKLISIVRAIEIGFVLLHASIHLIFTLNGRVTQMVWVGMCDPVKALELNLFVWFLCLRVFFISGGDFQKAMKAPSI